MAELAPNSFENLTQSGLLRITSKDDKNIQLSLDVYMGNASLVIFTGSGKPWKYSLSPELAAMMLVLLRKLQADPKPCREPIFLNEFVEENGKWKSKQKGCLGLGIGDDLIFFIDIAANDLQGRHQFPMKPNAKFDFSNTSMKEKELLQGRIQMLISVIENRLPVAMSISSFKRTGGAGGGRGNFGGGGGNRSGGGNYGGGGGGNRSGGTFGGGDSDNELSF